MITTPNTGASDLIRPGENGEVVPIRDAQALAQATLKWWHKIRAGDRLGGRAELLDRLSFARFERTFIGHLRRVGLADSIAAQPA